ncbi:molybdate-anion transporter MOT2 [Elsinoe ampelina]|uniref:Molybdate-anion transporter n=1 Tax=Elsinoe ampelina TaxID=302913 RepID=A0A6A6GBU8_9PEZI|nr:molybdate-anion transporter MOT2 [Elsinoe ampelina]
MRGCRLAAGEWYQSRVAAKLIELQGSYTHSIYRQAHGLSTAAVARLFAIGFASGGVAGVWTGAIADKYARKKLCLAYCLLYSVSCLAIIVSSDSRLLVLGRVLGGISTTLLYSVFETWLVAELHKHNTYSDFVQDCFASLALINGAVAIVCGVLSEILVSASKSQKAPFVASIFCLSLASVLIARQWVRVTQIEEVLTLTGG